MSAIPGKRGFRSYASNTSEDSTVCTASDGLRGRWAKSVRFQRQAKTAERYMLGGCSLFYFGYDGDNNRAALGFFVEEVAELVANRVADGFDAHVFA